MRRAYIVTHGTPTALVVQSRGKLTGFNLFAREVQKRERVLLSTSLSNGKDNMRVLSQLWRRLPKSQRMGFNKKAVFKGSLRAPDYGKRYSNYNLVMRLFSSVDAGVLLSAGDEKFIASLARRTAATLSASDQKKLQAKFDAFFPKGCETGDTTAQILVRNRSAYNVFIQPSMKFFSSFTEMQRSVAPTQKCMYVAVSRILFQQNTSAEGARSLLEKFDSFTLEQRMLFSPISDTESASFETFCVKNSAGMRHDRFNIVALFALYRGINFKHEKPSRELQSLHDSIASVDRVRDGAFFKVQRALQKLAAARSSDCGVFVHDRMKGAAVIPPSAYGIDSVIDDVTVATMLAESRHNQSVYDDVLERAALLRPKAKNAVLAVYRVSDILPTHATVSAPLAKVAARTTRQQATVKPAVAKPAISTAVTAVKASAKRSRGKTAVLKARAQPRIRIVAAERTASTTTPPKRAVKALVAASKKIRHMSNVSATLLGEDQNMLKTVPTLIQEKADAQPVPATRKVKAVAKVAVAAAVVDPASVAKKRRIAQRANKLPQPPATRVQAVRKTRALSAKTLENIHAGGPELVYDGTSSAATTPATRKPGVKKTITAAPAKASRKHAARRRLLNADKMILSMRKTPYVVVRQSAFAPKPSASAKATKHGAPRSDVVDLLRAQLSNFL